MWDLETGQVSTEVTASHLFDDQEGECTTMKRDPHDSKMIAVGVDEQISLLDMRKAGKNSDIAFAAHSD